jgi:CHAT domain-containing protein
LRSLIESFLRDISKVNEPKAVRQIQQTTRALYRSLFEPLRSSVTAKQLYVVNHQCLHFLPLETLHDGKHYLAEEYSFAYLPSASVLKFLHKAPRLPQSVLALGNPVIDYVKDLPPLSGAESESQAVVRDFPKGMAHVRADATAHHQWWAAYGKWTILPLRSSWNYSIVGCLATRRALPVRSIMQKPK